MADKRRRDGMLGRVLDEVETRTGNRLVPEERLEVLEAISDDYRSLQRELEDLGWVALDYVSGRPKELTRTKRLSLVQKARYAWMHDPMAGAAIDKLNDFVFGRGVMKPRAKDEEVQKVIDEAWDDGDNKRVLTTAQAQRELGTDFGLQDNLFILLFDDGEDGKVKLGLLAHDSVIDIVKDPENRLRPLWYLAEEREIKWDFENDRVKPDLQNLQAKKRYYEHWENVEVAKEERKAEPGDEPWEEPPKEKLGDGRVYHMAANKGMEQDFGLPEFMRTMRWFTAYNEFMASRVDMTKAAAAFTMKRTAKGGPSTLERLAQKALTRRSDLAASYDATEGMVAAPRGAAILNETDTLTHQDFKLTSGAGEAGQDAMMLRAQVSAGTHFPQHYLGDAGSANLATATSMELPVLKHVEARQKIFEDLFRWFTDRVIEHAVDSGAISKKKPKEKKEPAPGEAPTAGPQDLAISAAHEDQHDDEEATDRDLSYDFSMPNPLKRLMGDVVTASVQMVQALDPNGTNVDLSRLALTLILREAFDMEDAQDIVEQVFPEGYDPMAAIKAAQAGATPPPGQQPQPPPNFFGPDAALAGLTAEPSSALPSDANNPYGAKMAGTLPENVQQAYVVRGRSGQVVLAIDEAGRALPEAVLASLRARDAELNQIWDEEVGSVLDRTLTGLVVSTNGDSAK